MNPEHQSTQEVLRVIFRRLFDNSLTAIEISRFIKDVANILSDNCKITLPEAIQKLETLGWKKEIIDQKIFELIGLISPIAPILKK